MTSNKYQKANEKIKLSEAQKAAITENVLNADIKPVRKGMPGWGWVGIVAFGFVLLLALIMPMKPSISSAPALAKEETSETSADSYEGMDLLYEEESAVGQATNESMEESSFISKTELETRLGHTLPDFETLSFASHVGYQWINDETAQIQITSADSEILVRIMPEEQLCDIDAQQTVTADGLGYQIVVLSGENSEAVEEVKALIQRKQE